MGSDKKISLGKKQFVLIEDIGNIVVDVVPDKSSVLGAINNMKKLI
jgi:3-dehydroquinate synthetase